VARRATAYRGTRPPLDVAGRDVLIVDDGLATGLTMLAAVQWAHAAGARTVMIAAPVSTPNAVDRLALHVDGVVVLSAPEELWSVGEAYRDFRQTTDAEVVAAMAKAEGPAE
jgi:predicted phosphoribosyltransferase